MDIIDNSVSSRLGFEFGIGLLTSQAAGTFTQRGFIPYTSTVHEGRPLAAAGKAGLCAGATVEAKLRGRGGMDTPVSTQGEPTGRFTRGWESSTRPLG